MNILDHKKINIEICEVLGLNPSTTGEIVITLNPDDIPDIRAKIIPTMDGMHKIAEVLKHEPT